ncbi:MAG: alpha/beta fold hydrolase [Gammaproteobacteria bacterium]|nr:alpha/beta fold hydrolase [Gammaproteobacteria bacterium]
MRKIMQYVSAAILLQGLIGSCLAETDEKSTLISLQEAVTTTQQPADYRLNYGPGVFQFGDLRLPEGEGPYPLVVIIHGGCWTAKYGLHLMDAMAERLTSLGFATWNPEFRRIGMKGGEWSDIFTDVLMATHYVDNLASRFNLDRQNITLTGHSSGGHLVLWLAHQQQLINKHEKLNIKAVVSLAPLTDLSKVAQDDSLPCHDTVGGLMGGSLAEFPKRYQQASPVQMADTDLKIVVVNGDQDSKGFYRQFVDYRQSMKKRSRKISHLEVAPSGHFEMITPGTNAWQDLEKVFLRLK